MLKIELFQGEPIICKGISSDPLYPQGNYFILQVSTQEFITVYHSNIKHISAVL